MRKKRTPETSNGLSATQHDAIRLLVSGCTAKYTALVLKLNYANVRQWIKQDAQFQLELAAETEKQRAHLIDKKGQSRGKKIRADKSRSANTQAGKTRG
jgi:hypothetical protein